MIVTQSEDTLLVMKPFRAERDYDVWTMWGFPIVPFAGNVSVYYTHVRIVAVNGQRVEEVLPELNTYVISYRDCSLPYSPKDAGNTYVENFLKDMLGSYFHVDSSMGLILNKHHQVIEFQTPEGEPFHPLGNW